MATWTDRLRHWFRDRRNSARTDISTPENRRRARAYIRWADHGILRTFWTNQTQIAPGVWRSNHPSEARLKALSEQGIRTIISLRGSLHAPWALLEQETCDKYGIRLETIALQSRKAPAKAELQKLIALFRSAEKPLLFHCKSGADRAGLASAIYLLVIENRPLSEARKMLALRYIHLRWTRTGVLDMLLDQFDAAPEEDFETWLDQSYNPDALQAAFDTRRG